MLIKKINYEFIENIRDLLNNKLDKKINNNNNTNDRNTKFYRKY